MTKRKYGWCPQWPDNRDYRYSVTHIGVLPKSVDLTLEMPPIYDQGSLGSCTANAIGAVFQYEHIRAGLENFIPSRLFVYFNERAMEGTIRSDSGAMIRDGIKSIAAQGVCPENFWPYIVERFDIRPPTSCYTEAKKHTALAYYALPPSTLAIKGALATKNPVVFGFTVYESFEGMEVEQTGVMPLPNATERAVGGHAVVAVGYDDEREQLIVRNSWGLDWGQFGYFRMPYAYINSGLASDFWVIKKVV